MPSERSAVPVTSNSTGYRYSSRTGHFLLVAGRTQGGEGVRVASTYLYELRRPSPCASTVDRDHNHESLHEREVFH